MLPWQMIRFGICVFLVVENPYDLRSQIHFRNLSKQRTLRLIQIAPVGLFSSVAESSNIARCYLTEHGGQKCILVRAPRAARHFVLPQVFSFLTGVYQVGGSTRKLAPAPV